MPDFAWHRKLSTERMGNGKRLAKLRPANRFLDQFSENCVCVVVKSLHIGTGKQQEGVYGTAKVQFQRAAVLDTMEVARRNRGF